MFFYTATSHYTNDYFVSQATGTEYLDNYYLRKKLFGSDIKWGFQRKVRKHFVLEAFAGLGYKYKIVTETGRKAPSDPVAPPPPYTDINLSSISNETGSYGTINMPINFVIGYIFR